MEWAVIETKEVAGTILMASAAYVGEDILICVQGGERPHLGCVVQAVPRLSLKGDGKAGATSSVLNLTGHKDEFLCRRIAERVCRDTGKVVVCTGGFHLDGISEEAIREVLDAADRLLKKL